MQRIRRTASKLDVAKVCQSVLSDNSITPSEFPVSVAIQGLKANDFKKITKACRVDTETLHVNRNNKIEFRLQFSLIEAGKIRNVTKSVAQQAYLEGIYVAERYCALVNPGPYVAANANRVMDEYLSYIENHHSYSKGYQKELHWFKRDYQAGTDNENLEADVELVHRAQKFFHKIQSWDHDSGIIKLIKKVIKHDENPLVAMIAFRRIVLKHKELGI